MTKVDGQICQKKHSLEKLINSLPKLKKNPEKLKLYQLDKSDSLYEKTDVLFFGESVYIKIFDDLDQFQKWIIKTKNILVCIDKMERT